MPKALQRARRAMLRSFALCVVSFCVFTQFSSLLHMVFVEHSTCPEHGELVHGQARASASLAHAHTEVLPSAAFQADASSSELHEHEHCSVLGDGRQRALINFVAMPAVYAAAPAALRVTPRVAAHVSSVALYMIAPKSSPPA